MPYTVVRDTREKEGEGWTWRKSKYCDGTTIDTLATGDYTLLGFHNLLAIERKGSISEWAQNITQPRFERELERLELVRYPFILLEFTMADVMNYPVGSGIPRWRWKGLKFNGSYILKRMVEFDMRFRTKIILCGGSGKEVASSIFKRTVELIESGRETTKAA